MRELPDRLGQPPAQVANTPIDYVYAPENQEPSLRDYWRILRKRRRLVLIVFLTVFGLGAFVSFWWTRQYTAAAILKIDQGSSSAGESMAFGDDYLQTQIALLKSRVLAARVIRDLGLSKNPKFVDTPNPFEQVLNWLSGRLNFAITWISDLIAQLLGPAPPPDLGGPAPDSTFALGVHPRLISRYLRLLGVEQVRGTRLVRVNFTTVDPTLSRDLAAAHAATYIRMQIETRFELTKEAREFLEKKLAELKVKVERSEEALQRFRQAHGVVSLAGGENVVVDRMVDINRRLTDAKARRIELESLSRIVKGKNVEYLSQIATNSAIGQLKGRIDGLEAERARLATIFKLDHPRLGELDSQLREARQRLNLEINNVVRGIESDHSAARAREAALQAEAEQQQRAALNFKEVGVEYNLLQGELDANRAVYESVVKSLNESSVSNDSPLTNVRITDPPERPLGPSYPQTSLIMLLATFLGGVFGVGLAFLVEHLDSTVRTVEDVWRTAGLPTLGVVPHLKSLARREYAFGRPTGNGFLPQLTKRWPTPSESSSPALTVSYHPLSIIAECYRSIRTIILLGQGEKPPQVIVLTSAHPGDGKTTITLNLAITLAQSGRTVLVVDADLRQGNCHAHLAVQNRYGLSQLLTDDLPIDVCVQRTAVEGLSLLPRGSIPANPTDLLASPKMDEVLGVVRERFDCILIDTPPALAISDAAVLSVMSDGVILVLRSQTTTSDTTSRVVEHLQAVGARILGAVINGINIGHPDYADYRNYYSSYYAAAQKGKGGRGE